MGTVPVDLDSSLGFDLAVGVAPYVIAPALSPGPATPSSVAHRSATVRPNRPRARHNEIDIHGRPPFVVVPLNRLSQTSTSGSPSR